MQPDETLGKVRHQPLGIGVGRNEEFPGPKRATGPRADLPEGPFSLQRGGGIIQQQRCSGFACDAREFMHERQRIDDTGAPIEKTATIAFGTGQEGNLCRIEKRDIRPLRPPLPVALCRRLHGSLGMRRLDPAGAHMFNVETFAGDEIENEIGRRRRSACPYEGSGCRCRARICHWRAGLPLASVWRAYRLPVCPDAERGGRFLRDCGA